MFFNFLIKYRPSLPSVDFFFCEHLIKRTVFFGASKNENSQTCAPHWAQLQKLQLFKGAIVAFDSKTLKNT